MGLVGTNVFLVPENEPTPPLDTVHGGVLRRSHLWKEAYFAECSLHCKMKWLKLLEQKPAMADHLASLKELPLQRRGRRSHPCLRMGRQLLGHLWDTSLYNSLPSLMSQEGPAKLLDSRSAEGYNATFGVQLY